ncbi:MAG: hypothetical protein M3O70_26380 [Actinomycetota bacterium]|nr:hypothetical protein [Actinomycetota bacterium]
MRLFAGIATVLIFGGLASGCGSDVEATAPGERPPVVAADASTEPTNEPDVVVEQQGASAPQAKTGRRGQTSDILLCVPSTAKEALDSGGFVYEPIDGTDYAIARVPGDDVDGAEALLNNYDAYRIRSKNACPPPADPQPDDGYVWLCHHQAGVYQPLRVHDSRENHSSHGAHGDYIISGPEDPSCPPGN